MRLPMVLHALFIFFSCLLAYLLMPMPSIVLFMVGFFFMFVAVGAIYRFDVRRVLVLSLASVLPIVLIVLYAGQGIPPISMAMGLLETFYVLQAALWPSLLLPLMTRQYYVYGKPYTGVVSTFLLSILTALLSLFIAVMPVYGSIYLVFCIALLGMLEREYGSKRHA